MFGSASAEADDDDSRSIRTIVLHELERVEEEDEEQMVQQEEEQEARGTRRMELGRPKTLEPMTSVFFPSTLGVESKIVIIYGCGEVSTLPLQGQGARIKHNCRAMILYYISSSIGFAHHLARHAKGSAFHNNCTYYEAGNTAHATVILC